MYSDEIEIAPILEDQKCSLARFNSWKCFQIFQWAIGYNLPLY